MKQYQQKQTQLPPSRKIPQHIVSARHCFPLQQIVYC